MRLENVQNNNNMSIHLTRGCRLKCDEEVRTDMKLPCLKQYLLWVNIYVTNVAMQTPLGSTNLIQTDSNKKENR
jgi:hypothetical protein